MSESFRQQVVDEAGTIVVKIGTSVLTASDGTLDRSRLQDLAAQFHAIRDSGRQVVVVSSGAVGAGMGLLGLATRPNDLPHLQAAAATGQAWLIRRYEDSLREFGYHTAQLLLTANDFKQRARYLNVRNTLRTLFEYGVIPIVNENDSVSVDEIKFGDNDHLAAMVASLLPGSLLTILTTVDGLYDRSPDSPDRQLIPLVDEWNDDLLSLATRDASHLGTGGMVSKLQAIRLMTNSAGNAIIVNGTQPGILRDILDARPVGSWFRGRREALPAWKRWIGYTVPPHGQVGLDAGACRAITDQGRSLLAIGIRQVQGEFAKGETVALTDPQGAEIARGLSNYSAEELRAIAGHRTDEVASILGHLPYGEVVHRDNLVITAAPARGS